MLVNPQSFQTPDSQSPNAGEDSHEGVPVGYERETIYAVTYSSEAVGEFSDRDVTELLFAARRFNAQHGVTGRLLVLEDEKTRRVTRFVQWLEGPEVSVQAVMKRVQADPRHRKIEVLVHGPAQQRRYAEWDMAFGRTSSPEEERAARLAAKAERPDGDRASE